MDLIEATINALQGKLEEKPNKDNAEINAKILEPNANKAELQRNGYNVSRADGFTSVKRADRVDDFREVDVFDDGTVMTVNDDTIVDKPVNKDVFDAKAFLDTDRKKPYEAPNKVSKFKMNKDTIAQANDEIADAEREKEANPDDAEILDKNVIEPWKKLKDKADAENKEMLKKKTEGEEPKDTFKSYYFEVGVEDDEGLDRKVPYYEIPYKTMDENLGMCKTFGEAFDYVNNYIKQGINKTYGIIVEVDIGEKEYNSIEGGWSDAYDYYNMKLGKLRYSAYKDENGKYVVAFDDTKDISLFEGRKVLGEHIVVEARECLKEKTLTWEEIMTNAEGTTFGQQSLKVKDTARDNVEQLLVKAGVDIDNVESVEDEIEKYCKDNNIKFDTHGNLITECEKVTEDVVTMEEAFYAKICKAYVNTANLEWVTTNPENNNSVVHGYFASDDIAEKYDYGAKVTPKNFKDVAYEGHTDEEIEDGDVEWYEYDTWEDFYDEYVKDEILYDIDDIGTYPGGTTEPFGNWDFYISKEDLIKLGLWDEVEENLDENKLIEDVADIKPELKSTAFPDRPYSEALLKLCKNGTLDLQFVINCFVTGLPEETVKKICQDNAIDAHMLDLEGIKTENKKVTEDYTSNVFDKAVSIENENGDTLMQFKVSPSGELYGFENCDIADEEDNLIRVQQIGIFGGLTESKKQESVVSDYTLSEIKKVLDSEETEYGYSLKITNSGADAETKTLDLDKSDLQAIYDALSKNKVTESKLVEGDTDVFSKLNDEIKQLPDANLDYKGICSLIAGYIEGIVGVEDNAEAMSKINIDLVREIADAVFNEDDVWEPMDDFIYSEIYAKLGIN